MENTITNRYSELQTPEHTKNIDMLLDRQEQKSSATVYNKFKTLWNKHKIARFVTGVALAGGAIAATATGATAVAGGLVATRAILGALGGYMATDAALDMADNKLTKNKLEKLISRIDSGESATDLEREFQDIHRELSESLTPENIEREMEKAKKTHRIKKTAKKVIASIAGIGIGLIGGTHAVEAATTTSSETISLVKSKVGNILDTAAIPSVDTVSNTILPKPTIQNVLDDIRTDHPKQGYVTLEQAVRRMEWLKQGIDLDHSSLLKKMNASVYGLVRDPDGSVMKAMKDLHLLGEWQNIDDIAKKLTERQISDILEKAYGTDFMVQWDVLQNGVSPDTTDSLMNPEQTVGKVAETPVVSPDMVQKSNTFGWMVGWGMVVAAGMLGWFGWKGFKKQKVSQNTDTPDIPEASIRPIPENPAPNGPQGDASPISRVAPSEELPQERPIIPEPESSPTEATVLSWEFIPAPDTIYLPDNSARYHDQPDQGELPKTLPVVTPQIAGTSAEDLEKLTSDEEKRMNCFVAFRWMIDKYFWFSTLIENDSNITENGFGKIVFSKPTLGWEFRTSYMQSPIKNGEIELSWYDNKTKKSTITKTPSSPEEMAIVFEKMFIEMLKKRDEIKNQEMLTLHTVEIDEQDLEKMYEQLEHPYVLQNGTETGGYWFQSCYGLQNGVLRFENLVNPTMDEMDLTGSSFSIRAGSDYIWKNKTAFLRKQFEEKERVYIVGIYNITHTESLNTDQEKTMMNGAVRHFNYHKHPGYLNHPSLMDLNHKHAWVGRFNEDINTKVLTWFIINELPSHINESNKPINSHILKRSRYGWQRDYIVHFWKVHRNATNSNYRVSDCIPLDYRII